MKYFIENDSSKRKALYDEWSNRPYDYVFFSFGKNNFNEANFSYILVDRKNNSINTAQTGQNSKMFLFPAGQKKVRQSPIEPGVLPTCRNFNQLLKDCKFAITHDFLMGHELLKKEIHLFDKEIHFDQYWCTQELTQYRTTAIKETPLRLVETYNLLFGKKDEEEKHSLKRLEYIRKIYFRLISSDDLFVDPFHPELTEYRE